MATRVDHVRDELKALKAYGRLGRAKARLGEANTLTSDDSFDDAGGGNVLLAVGARRKRRARLERRFNQASDLPPEREARALRRGAAGSSVGPSRQEARKLPLGRPVAARRRRQGQPRRRGTTSRACPRSSPRRRRPSICSSGRCTRTWSSRRSWSGDFASCVTVVFVIPRRWSGDCVRLLSSRAVRGPPLAPRRAYHVRGAHLNGLVLSVGTPRPGGNAPRGFRAAEQSTVCIHRQNRTGARRGVPCSRTHLQYCRGERDVSPSRAAPLDKTAYSMAYSADPKSRAEQ